ncbi:MAG: FxLYD domain-containing protein [Planctomycetota bacterium]
MNGVFVETTGTYRQGYIGHAGVSGIARNDTGRDLQALAIYFDVLNDEDEKVADAAATTSSLKAGQIWRFQAVFLAPFGAEFAKIRLARVLAP